MFIENRMLIRATCCNDSTYTGTLYETTIQPDKQDDNKPHTVVFIDQDERYVGNEGEFGIIELLADDIRSIEVLDDDITQRKIKDENTEFRHKHRRKGKKVLYYDASKYPEKFRTKSKKKKINKLNENGKYTYTLSYPELESLLKDGTFDEIQVFATRGTFYSQKLDKNGNPIEQVWNENCWINLGDYHLISLDSEQRNI